MFFYWEKRFDGKWCPVMSADKPNKKGPDGRSRRFTGVVALKSPEDTFDLESLAELYPVKEGADA